GLGVVLCAVRLAVARCGGLGRPPQGARRHLGPSLGCPVRAVCGHSGSSFSGLRCRGAATHQQDIIATVTGEKTSGGCKITIARNSSTVAPARGASPPTISVSHGRPREATLA